LRKSRVLSLLRRPPPRRFGFWPWSRSRSDESYRYLTRSVIEQIRRAPRCNGVVGNLLSSIIAARGRATRGVFDYYHRHVRRMQNGLAYHFVIGNGTFDRQTARLKVGDPLAPPDQRRPCPQRLSEQYLARHLSGGRFQSRTNQHGRSSNRAEELIRYLRSAAAKPPDTRSLCGHIAR